ncbi:unnamed protein product [Acanthoscelides obtectus]|uniref:Uncharacterized protein n=1 Tax=Acanthoscelides obtectus TaxID=200917 RepID=A0A9P0LLN1_ACAOB|nr:unnamed protein product [Acanthoscelides obtectus]CAK1620912.1 hypothetical protein AOBTE_LOCUS647 [Acanthoscelides obtectus]
MNFVRSSIPKVEPIINAGVAGKGPEKKNSSHNSVKYLPASKNDFPIINWINADCYDDKLCKMKRKTESAQVKIAIDNFEKCIVDVRNNIDDIINEAKSICTEPQGNKRRRRNNSSHDHPVAALEVCDNRDNMTKSL